MTEKILILFPEKNHFYFREIKKRNINIEETYTNLNNHFWLRIIRKLWMKLNIPFKFIWYGKWKKIDFCKFNEIILFNTLHDRDILRFIKKKNPSCRIIVWNWDPIISIGSSILNDDTKKYEVWSFDYDDCKKYNLFYNSQFYFKVDNIKNKPEYDVFFIGIDKGRYKTILKLEDEFAKRNVTTKILIVKNRYHYYGKKQKFLLNEGIPYDEVIDYIKKSKAVLEINQEDQSGLTIRALECLFYEKKLITNNKNIKNEKFYSAENIFILGEDNLQKLDIFLRKPYFKVNPEIVEYFDFKKWIDRFK